MKGTVYTLIAVLALSWSMMACAQPGTEESPAAEPESEVAEAAEDVSFPDPGPEEAQEVEDFVRGWITDRASEEGTYGIPPRGGHEVSGTLAGFHTVHQKDADTYAVCVDFEEGENTYDVDFFLDRTSEGLTLAEHYLHKVNGEAIE